MQTAKIALTQRLMRKMNYQLIEDGLAVNETNATLILIFILKKIRALNDDNAKTYNTTIVFMWNDLVTHAQEMVENQMYTDRASALDAFDVVLSLLNVPNSSGIISSLKEKL